MKEGKQMKKRWMSLILTVIMMLSLAGCGRNANLSSVSRDPADSDGTVWFDEEAVALAGSVQRAGMSEAEIARANELRTMATDALALVNAKRAENGLAELTWSNGLESCAMVRAQESGRIDEAEQGDGSQDFFFAQCLFIFQWSSGDRT